MSFKSVLTASIKEDPCLCVTDTVITGGLFMDVEP